METTWKPKTRYFIILNNGQLKQALGESVEEKMKYKPKEDESQWLLEDVCRCLKYLPANKIAIDIQISNAMYVDEQGVFDYITEQDFELAKLQFGVTEFMSEEEYKALEQIEY